MTRLSTYLLLLLVISWPGHIWAGTNQSTLGILDRLGDLTIAPLDVIGDWGTISRQYILFDHDVCGNASAACSQAAADACRRNAQTTGSPLSTVTFKKCELPALIGTGKCSNLRRLDAAVCW